MRHAVAFADGGGGPGQEPFACAAVLHVIGEHDERHERSRDLGRGLTNNIAEWEGLILALDLARELGVTHLKVRCDSRLIVEQALGNWRVRMEHLKPLHARAMELAANFESLQIDWVRREKNVRADQLCREVLASAV